MRHTQRASWLAFAVAILAIEGCSTAGPDELEPAPVAAGGPDDVGPAPAAASGPAPAGVQGDGTVVSAVDWFHGSLEQALAHAREHGRLVLVSVGAYWCPPCHELEEKTFVDARVGAHLRERYVALHVDAEQGEGPELAERYHVQAYPTTLVLEPSGMEKARILDFVEPDALLDKLAAIEAGGNILADLERAARERPDDLEAAYAYGNALALAARREEAMLEFDRVLAGDPDNAKGLAAQVLYDRAMFITFKIDGDLAGAVKAYRELQARFPASKPAVRAYRQLARVLHEQGKRDEAIAALDAMLATDPDDVGLMSSYAWFCFREKCRPDKGLRVLRTALEKSPENAELHYLAAELHHQLGDHAAARDASQKASELEPTTAYYRRQAQRFRQLAGKQG